MLRSDSVTEPQNASRIGAMSGGKMWQLACKYITYPAWDFKDGRGRLREYRSLQRSQWLAPDVIRELQLRRLREIVAYAHKHCEFYRIHWRSEPRIDSHSDLLQVPILTKAHIRAGRDELVSDCVSKEALVEAKTGGSTGVALQLLFDGACQKSRNAAAMRSDEWAGWRPGMLVGALWGTPPIPKTWKERVRNNLHDRFFYLDTMQLSEESMSAFAAEMWQRRPGALFGHAHSLFILAKFLRDSGTPVPPLQGIIATSMMLLESERKIIHEVFHCDVTNRYGCEEVGLIGSECELHNGLHLNSEHVFVEFLREDGSWAPPGEEGKIVVTDLMNRGMPLIRYSIEDLGVPSGRMCGCGRGLPLMERLVGRTADFLKRADGTLVAGVSLVERTLTAVEGVDQLQIVQEELDRFVLNVVAGEGFTPSAQRELSTAMHDAFGQNVSIDVRQVERLPQERNSKYRFAVCRV